MLHNDEHYISNSEIQTFKRCRRKWYLGWYLGLETKYEDYSSLMRSGTRVHKVLAQMYVQDSDPELNLMEILDRIIEEDRAKILSNYPTDDESESDLGYASSALIELEKIAAYERAMISGYIPWIEETGIDSQLVPITSEQEIIVEHSTLPINFVGIVDALLWDKIQGGLVFIDHKTVQSLTQMLTTLKMNEQMLHYIFLLTMGTGEKVIGAHYNMLRRVKRTAAAKPPFYDRVFIGHSSVEIESYRKHLYAVAYAIYSATNNLIERKTDNAVVNHYMYPSPTMNCSWECPFFSMCPMFDDGSDVQRMIDYRYVKSDPLARYESINVIRG